MTRASSMSRPLSAAADVAARRDEDDVVLRLTGAATIASTGIGTMCVSLEARRKVARVEPSNQAPVVRASKDDEIEACVRPRELARCERCGRCASCFDRRLGKVNKNCLLAPKKTPFWLIWSDR